MPLEIREVAGKKELKAFIRLPVGIYRGVPQWVPPIWSDERTFHDPAKYPAYRTADTVRYLAWRGGEPVGRVMGIVQKRMNERWRIKNARFTFLECPDEREICAALLGVVEGWARDRGMETVTGPHGFSDQDCQGMLIQGFEHRATLETFYNLPYLRKLVEACGYSKDFDYRVFRVPIPAAPPPLYVKVKERLERRGFVLVEFTKRKALIPHIPDFVRIYNDTFDEVYGFVSLTPEEGKKLISDYLPVIDPRFVKFIYKLPVEERGRPVVPGTDEVVAFFIGIPDMTEGIQAAGGRLFPFGFLKIMAAQRRTEQLDLMIAGVTKAYRNRGLAAMFGVGLIRDANAAGFTYADAHQELEFNTKVQAEMLRLGGREYKRMRVYKKAVAPGGLERYDRAFEHHHGFGLDDPL